MVVAGLGLAVAVAVAVGLDAAAGQRGQDALPAGNDHLGWQAGDGRPLPGGADDRAAGGGEGDLAGVHGLAGAASPAGRDGDRRCGTGGGGG